MFGRLLSRWDVYETHPGWYGVYDRKRGGHLPFEFKSPKQALAEAKRLSVLAAQGKIKLDLILDEEVDGWTCELD